jgi:hypothetical protein
MFDQMFHQIGGAPFLAVIRHAAGQFVSSSFRQMIGQQEKANVSQHHFLGYGRAPRLSGSNGFWRSGG